MNLIRTIFLIERKNLKFKSVIAVLLLFIIGSFIYINESEFRELEPSTASEVVALNSALEQFRNVDATDPEVASPLYQNLIHQSSELANSTLGLTMEDESTYINGAIALSELRSEVYELEGFEAVADFIPTERENELQGALFNSIEAQDAAILVENDNFPTYILFLILCLGVGWYLGTVNNYV